MERLRRALDRLSERPVRVAGYTDLVLGDRKFSGSAQYRRKGAILFHGTVMLDMDVRLIEETLAMPPRAPEYRRGRSHLDFLTNLEVSSDDVRDAFRAEWEAAPEFGIEGRESILERIHSFNGPNDSAPFRSPPWEAFRPRAPLVRPYVRRTRSGAPAETERPRSGPDSSGEPG
jgi:hypothetical protein